MLAECVEPNNIDDVIILMTSFVTIPKKCVRDASFVEVVLWTWFYAYPPYFGHRPLSNHGPSPRELRKILSPFLMVAGSQPLNYTNRRKWSSSERYVGV